MSIEAIKASAPPDLIDDSRAADISNWGFTVNECRSYVMGQQYVYLTQTQREMLNIQNASYESFNANYCEQVVRMMADRLTLSGFQSEDIDNDWLQDWQHRCDFDELQIDTHEAILRDGDAFLLTDFTEDGYSIPRLNYAYDGNTGVVPIYDGAALLMAIKVEEVGGEYQAEMWEPALVTHLAHRRLPGRSYGMSEVSKIISLQDILNRILASMVISGELSAFQVRFAKGFEPPRTIEPGAVIAVDAPAEKLASIDFRALQQGSLTEYITEINRVITLIADITQTPLPGLVGPSASGESRKQYEIGLLGKVRAAQVKIGNGWERVVQMCAALDNIYANGPGESFRIDARWESPVVRTVKESAEIAGMVFDKVFDKQLYIEMMGEILDWTAARQEEIVERLNSEEGRRLEQMAAMAIGGEIAEKVIDDVN